MQTGFPKRQTSQQCDTSSSMRSVGDRTVFSTNYNSSYRLQSDNLAGLIQDLASQNRYITVSGRHEFLATLISVISSLTSMPMHLSQK